VGRQRRGERRWKGVSGVADGTVKGGGVAALPVEARPDSEAAHGQHGHDRLRMRSRSEWALDTGCLYGAARRQCCPGQPIRAQRVVA
jgi:hypothetical protein